MTSPPPSPAAPSASVDDPLLTVENLVVQFKTEDGWVTAVDGLSYELRKGETLGIVGESGSGKSVTNLAVMRLLPEPERASRIRGRITFDGTQILRLNPRQMRSIRGRRVAMIFQDPMTSLNPFLRVSSQMTEMLHIHQKLSKAEAEARSIAMLERVGIPGAESRFRAYPHQFSGGMRQRVMIAMMLLNHPELLIADEPTTALDVTIQAQILDLLEDLQRDFGMAITLITHDLGVVAGMADRIVVMYSGKTMEAATAEELFGDPSHPYTIGLLRSIPRPNVAHKGRLFSIPGRPPDLDRRPQGCPFAPRCDYVRSQCQVEMPPETELSPTHRVACWAIDDVRASVADGSAGVISSEPPRGGAQ